MNSSVKFFDPMVSVVAAFAGLLRISFDLAAGCSVFWDSAGSSSPPPQPASSNRTSTKGAAAERSIGAIIPRPPDGGRGNAQDYLTKPACWR